MNRLFLIIFLFVGFFSHAQEYLRPIIFDGLQPNWQQFIIDSTTLNDPKKLGFQHITTKFILVRESDEVAYFIYWDSSERYQGAYIQKRNVITGQVIWSNLYNLSNSERHEFPRSAFLDKDDNLVIVNLRNNDPNFTSVLWYRASPAVRTYDKDSGDLVSYIHADEPINDDNQILFYSGLNNTTIFGNDKKLRHVQNKPYGDTIFTITKTYNENGFFDALDTSIYWRPYKYWDDGGFYPLQNGQILNLVHSTNQSPNLKYESQNFDQYSYAVNVYSDDFKTDVSKDLFGIFPYNWKMNYIGNNGSEFWLLCGDSIVGNNFSEESSKALVFINNEGKPIETIDFRDNRYEVIYAVKESNSNGAYIITQDYIQKLDPNTKEFVAEITFWKSNGSGEISKLKALQFRDERTLYITSASLIGKNIVLGTYMRQYENPNDAVPQYQIKGLLGFNIDVITASEDVVIGEPKISIHPNPTSGTIHINGVETPVLVTISNVGGQHVKVYQDIKDEVDISDLPAGMYILDIRGKDFREQHKVVKME